MDIAIPGENIGFDTASRTYAALEDESSMLDIFDIEDYVRIETVALKDPAGRVRTIIYERKR
jgi:hypothetical protein